MPRKSFRYWTKENFETCLRSVGLVFTEIWPFSWKSTFWTSNFWQFLTFFSWVKMNGSHRKWRNSVITRLSYLGEVSKFSLVQYLKLFLGTQKIYWVEKCFRRANFFEKWHFLVSSIRIAQNLPQFLFWLFSAIFHSNWDL